MPRGLQNRTGAVLLLRWVRFPPVSASLFYGIEEDVAGDVLRHPLFFSILFQYKNTGVYT